MDVFTVPAENQQSRRQYAALMITLFVSCTASILGSSGIVYMTLSKGIDTILRRLLFALSLSDLGCSISLVLNALLLPRDAPGAYWALGNAASCQATGYLVYQFAIFTAFINCYLSLYFVLSVRYGWNDRRIPKVCEVLVYTVAFAVPMIIGVFGVWSQSFNPQEYIGLCNWDIYPWGCEDDPDVECRGELSYVLGWVSIVLLFTVSAIGLVSVFLVFLSVRSRLKAGSQYNFNTNIDEEAMQRLRRVKMQAILYSAVYFNSFVWPTLAGVVGEIVPSHAYTDIGPFLVNYLCWLFYPLQGLGNFVVYTYPSIQRWRRADPNLGLIRILGRVLRSQEPRNSKRSCSKAFRISSEFAKSNLMSQRQNQSVMTNSGEFTLGDPSKSLRMKNEISKSVLGEIVGNDVNDHCLESVGNVRVKEREEYGD